MVRTAHRAKFILAEPNRLLQDAVIHISNSGRISRIEPWKSSAANPGVSIVDWGSAVIVPGMINAHSHLELTSLHGQLARPNSFTDWLSELIARRRLWTAEDFMASALEGARLSLSCGTTLAGDITSSGVGWKASRSVKLRRVVFEEVVALSPSRADQALRRVNRLFKQPDPTSMLAHGISPHAPYSVSSELYRRAAELAQNRGMLITTHAAETKAELKFLDDGTGEFRDFLIAMDALPKGWDPPALPPVQYLKTLGVLGRNCILAHCNYLDQESIRCIKSTRTSVVYCPRSHDFFGHQKHPVRHLLDAGVTVALGTDSLASNSSLSMIEEMRFLFKKRKDLMPEEIFRAATSNGAAALHFRGILGRLRRGYLADMAILELPKNVNPRRLLSQILEGAGECIATIIQGQTAWQRS